MQDLDVAAATRLQAFVRSWQCKRELSQRKCSVCELELNKKTSAVTSIQAMFRSWMCKRELMHRREQAHQVQITLSAAATIQAMVRSWICQRERLHRLERAREFEDEREAIAAATIQAMVRSWRCQRELSQRIIVVREIVLKGSGATAVQLVVRSWQSQSKLLPSIKQDSEDEPTREMAAAIMIQSFVRSWQLRIDLLHRKVQSLHSFARVIQKNFKIRRIFQKQRAAIKIQSIFRSWRCRREILQEVLGREITAAQDIQRYFRSFRSRLVLSTTQSWNHHSLIQKIETCVENIPHVHKGDVADTSHEELPVINIQTIARNHLAAIDVRVMNAEIVVARAQNDNMSKVVLIRGKETVKPVESKSSVLLIQSRLRGFLVRNKLSDATNAARVIQRTWRRCVISLRMKLVQIFEFLSSTAPTHGISMIPSSMKKARILLPRDSRSLNRIRDITPQLPRHHECGVFVEEILNSVTVVIQCAARRYIAKKKWLKLYQAACCIQHALREAVQKTTLRETTSSSAAIQKVDERRDEEAKMEEPNQISVRFSTDYENEMFILAQIYQHAQANADATYFDSGDSSACVSQYVKKFMHATEQDTPISK